MIVRRKEKITFVEALTQLKSVFSDDFIAEIEMVSEGLGLLVAYFMTLTPFEASGDEYILMFSDKSMALNKVTADMFWYIYIDGIDYSTFAHRQLTAIDLMADYECKRDFVQERIRENGQSKICVSTLEMMCNSDKEVHILVLGSSSEDTYQCGKTYEALLDYLTIAGYEGSMLLVDPHENPMVRQVGNFHYRTVNKKYDYDTVLKNNNGGDFTHVYEDVWVPTHTKDLHEPIEYRKVSLHVVEGRSKFAYALRGDRLIFKSGLKQHKDLRKGLGGGVMVKDGNVITIAGTSNRLGPFDPKVVMDALSSYDVYIRPDHYKRGRKTWDPDSKLFDLYPNARISTKYYGEGYKSGFVRDQIWYTGLEKRLYYNCSLGTANKMWGCGCDNCRRYGYIISNFKVYRDNVTSEDVVRGVLSRVIDDPCLKAPRYKYNLLIGDILAASHKNVNLNTVVDDLVKKRKVSFRAVERTIRMLINTGKIGVEGKIRFSSEYNIVNYNSDRVRYFSRKYPTRYMVVETDIKTGKAIRRYYDKGVEEIIKCTHRPGEITEYCEIVEWYIENFGFLFNSFNGLTGARMTGIKTCGDSSDYHYWITKSSVGLYPHQGYSLVVTSKCPY